MTRYFLLLSLLIGACLSLPQQQSQLDFDYLYDDLVQEPNLQQAQPSVVVERARARPQPAAQQPQVARRPSQQSQQQARILGEDSSTTTTPIPILRDIRRTDPVTGAFIYDYMGADGQAKYEVRFRNGTVIGNFTFINDQGERETRWYSAGERGTEIAGDSVISPAPPTLVDETTDPGYVDLSNYELYRHLEVPYVHIEGPSDPDERGQLSNPSRQEPARAQPPRQVPVARPPQPSSLPLDFGDETRFVRVNPQQAAAPQQTSRARVRVAPSNSAPLTTQQRAQTHFNAANIDASSPDAVLDSLIRQFQ